MMRTRVNYVLSLSVALVLFGCGPSDVEIRRENTIGDLSGQSPNIYYDPAHLLSQVKASTPRSLRSPELCQSQFAFLDPDRTEAILSLYWIENQPTVDAIRLTWDSEVTIFGFPTDIRASNDSDATVGVIFSFVLHLPADNQRVLQLLRTGQVPSVQLLKHGEPVSHPVIA